MKLAEALIDRADLQKRIEQLQSRIAASARYQEGEPPAEDAAALLAEADAAVDALERLVTAINLSNAETVTADGRTLTEVLAVRESLRLRHSLLARAADAAAGGGSHRQMRSELRQLPALPVSEVRARADAVAQALREIDVLVQRTNWEADLRTI